MGDHDPVEGQPVLDERGQNDGERWFERYLHAHGYDYIYEPDLGVPSRPDFLVSRNGVEVVCEVKSFQQPTRLELRLAGSNQAMAFSAEEEYGPMRNAVRQAARQLKPLAGSDWPLVVVLANPLGYRVNLSLERLAEAMLGNPGYAGRFNPEEGRVEDFHFEYGRDGRLRNNHPYVSGVAIVHERDLWREHYGNWYEEWKASQSGDAAASYEDAIAGALAAQEAWEASEARRNAPEGTAYWLELLTSGSPEAVALPDGVFDGPRDRRRDVERRPQV